MNLSCFDYHLPAHLIAQQPESQRDGCRLLIVNREKQKIEHDIFSNIGKYLPKESVLVLNNSKVIPARLLGRRQQSGGQVEVFLLKRLDAYHYEALIKPLKRIKQDEPLEFAAGVTGRLINKEQRIVRFNINIAKKLPAIGRMPLPPYIQRDASDADGLNYQTVYAKHPGSVASPTAGLHFTQRLLNKLQNSGHRLHALTLHVNYGTFKPVESQDITKHDMHFEEYRISKKVWSSIQTAKKREQKIVAVGTTGCRVLETCARTDKTRGSTNIFIYPGFSFRMTDILLTNFHLPKSTLLMLIYAFGGMDFMRHVYAQAIKKEYRFYSYGDAMLIL